MTLHAVCTLVVMVGDYGGVTIAHKSTDSTLDFSQVLVGLKFYKS